MIVIKIELWPLGFESHKREIGRMHITNKGTNTGTRGDYKVDLMRRKSTNKVLRTGDVDNFPRKSKSIWKLVLKSLKTVFPEEK
jgi:hypothetical protein